LGDLGVDGKVILIRILNKQYEDVDCVQLDQDSVPLPASLKTGLGGRVLGQLRNYRLINKNIAKPS